MPKIYLLHPFLFALAPAVFLWTYNFQEVLVWRVLAAMAVLVIFAGIVLLLCKFFFRDFLKAGIFASVFLLFTLCYQYIFFSELTMGYMRQRYAFFIVMAIIAASGYILVKTKRDLAGVARIFTIVAGTFIIVAFFQVALILPKNFSVPTKENLWDEIGRLTAAAEEKDKLRDIYYIIFDEYVSPKALKEVLGREEGYEIVDFLRDRKFFVAENSESRYIDTISSLFSSLNMQYIDISLSFKRRMLKDNLIKDFLREQGYYFIQFGSMWPFTYYNKYADENINVGFLSPYQATLWEMSIFSPINKKFNLFDDLRIRKLQWAREKYQLSKLAEIPRRNEPTFVFAHMGITHTPYVFDSDGNFITKEEVGKKSTLENYLNQIRYTNKQIKILVDEILNKSPREPIIIIQSDHGLRLDLKAKEELSKENLLPDEEGINRLAHGILNAYYFPDGGDKILYDSISPVNTFRVLLNYYFNQKFALFGDE